MTLTSSAGHTIIASSIWAQDRNGVIGSGTDMLWHVPADYKHFKETTIGSPIIMGRASWEALGAALPGRANIVMTSQTSYNATGAIVVPSLHAGINAAIDTIDNSDKVSHQHLSAFHVWFVGGSTIYRQAMDLVDELVITDLDLDVLAIKNPVKVVSAPHIDPDIWMVDSSRSDSAWRQKSGDAQWRVTTYIRRNRDNQDAR